MPIEPIVLQRRLREVGRLRAGDQTEYTKSDGSTGTRPRKLAKFRMTSRDQAVLDAAAALPHIGGKISRWADAPSDDEQWQLYTDTSQLQVVLPPGEVAFSQWFELWSKGGCQRRCNGLREVIGDQACLCDPKERDCDVHTRLSVILPELPGLGVWRLDTQSWYGSTELAGAVDVCRALTDMGRLVPARLSLEQREVKRKDAKGKPITLKFIVPVLDLPQIPLAELMAAATPIGEALEANGEVRPAVGWSPVATAALPAAPSSQRSVADQVVGVNDPPEPRPRSNAATPIPSTGLEPRPVGGASAATGEASSASPSEGSKVVEDRARQVAMWCRDAGLDDDGRHSFLEAFSGGRYRSAKAVPADDLAGLRAALVELKRGGDWPSAAESPAADATSGDVSEEWDQARWLAAAENVRGVGQGKLLKRAREIATEIGVDPPLDLDHVPAQVGVGLLAWLKEQQAA